MPEVVSLAPRAQPLEVAHLEQLFHKNLDTVEVMIGQATVELNEDGFGIAHNGSVPNVFQFIFDIPAFFALTDQQRVDVFEYVLHFDQGTAPGAPEA